MVIREILPAAYIAFYAFNEDKVPLRRVLRLHNSILDCWIGMGKRKSDKDSRLTAMGTSDSTLLRLDPEKEKWVDFDGHIRPWTYHLSE